MAAVAGRVGMTMTWAIFAMAALDFLRSLPDASVDLIITDPAYESLNRHRATGTTARLKSFFPTIPNAQYATLAVEWRRVLKVHGAIFLFGDATTQLDVANAAMQSAGWRVHAGGSTQLRKVAVWDKRNMGMGYGLREQTEIVYYWRRSTATRNPSCDRSVRNLFRSDPDALDTQCQAVKSLRGKNRWDEAYYTTQKPVDGLLDVFVEQTTLPGDLVIDSFAGSGSTGAAALSKGRRFLGCDIHPPALEYSHRWLTEDFGPPTGTLPDGQCGLFR